MKYLVSILFLVGCAAGTVPLMLSNTATSVITAPQGTPTPVFQKITEEQVCFRLKGSNFNENVFKYKITSYGRPIDLDNQKKLKYYIFHENEVELIKLECAEYGF